MGKIKKVNLEYERLKALFKSVDPTKTELVDNLLNEAAFMKEQLSNLRIQIEKMVQSKYQLKVLKDKQKQLNIIQS